MNFLKGTGLKGTRFNGRKVADYRGYTDCLQINNNNNIYNKAIKVIINKVSN